MNTAPTAFCANCRGDESNCRYPNKIVIDGIEAFRRLVSYDHVFTEFKDNYRSNKNFIRAWGLPEDIDNDHSDKPEDWIYPADIAAFFTNVRHFIHYSRHHMKQKGGKSPKPRFHVDFIIDEEDDYETFANLKKQVFSVFPFFDDQAQDVARFLYGTESPEVEYHDGSLTLTAFMKEYEAADAFANMDEVITEGHRNSTLSRFAGRIIVKLDDTEEAHNRFLEEAKKCDVPLPDNELRSIWKSAQGFLKKIKSTGTYVVPGAYSGKSGSEIKWQTPIPFDEFTLPTFPVEALPMVVRDYVLAVSESTQTPVDMSASAALGVLSICIHDRKLDALEDLIEAANGKPVLVAYWFKHDLERISTRLKDRHIPFTKLDTSGSITSWNEGAWPVALIHPASAGHGLNLQSGGSTIIWFGLTWSLELYQQTNARLWRQGQNADTVVLHHIIAKKTIDERVMKALRDKDKTQTALIDAVKANL